jgi:hypothetical protein
MDQIVYILINEAMPGYVKIGKTSGLEQRVRDLSRASGVPLPFEVFYAAKVRDMNEAEKLIHDAFGDTRVAPNREFFKIAPERVVAALKLAQIENVTPQSDFVDSPEEQVALDKARRNRFRFNFEMVKIPPGSILQFTRDPQITCKVINDTQIEYNGVVKSLSDAAKSLLGVPYPVQGPVFWTYENETLDERRRRFEEGNDEQ